MKFDYLKHYQTIFGKYTKFIRDFKLMPHISYVEIYGKNPSKKCRSHDGEPDNHAEAKNKIFELFLRNHSYLIETELAAIKPLDVFYVGERAYQFDILVLNIPFYLNSYALLMDLNLNNNIKSLSLLKQWEPCTIFAIEIDGKSHVDRKDKLRDDFFFSEYNVVTVRYDVRHLVQVEETEQEQKARLKFNFFKKNSNPLFHDITTAEIVNECRNIYYSKYPDLR
jgi:hypothetical protein